MPSVSRASYHRPSFPCPRGPHLGTFIWKVSFDNPKEPQWLPCLGGGPLLKPALWFPRGPVPLSPRAPPPLPVTGHFSVGLKRELALRRKGSGWGCSSSSFTQQQLVRTGSAGPCLKHRDDLGTNGWPEISCIRNQHHSLSAVPWASQGLSPLVPMAAKKAESCVTHDFHLRC